MPPVVFAHKTDMATGSELLNCFAQSTRGEKEESPYVVQVCAGSRRVNTSRFVHVNKFNGSIYGITGTGDVYRDVHTASPALVASTGTTGTRWWAISTRLHMAFGLVGGPPFAIGKSGALEPVGLTDPVGSATVIADSGVYAIHNSDRFWVTEVSNITAVNNLAFATAQVRDDTIRRVATVGETVLFLGADTTERWYVSGASLMPLARYSNAVSEVGLANGNALCHIPDALIWVSRDLQVMMGLGSQAKVISTRPLHEFLERVSTESFDGYMASYSLFGRWFAVLTVGGRTYEYDVAENLWHTRLSPGQTQWLPEQFVTLDRKIYWASPAGMMVMDDLTATEDGQPVPVSMNSALLGSYESRSDKVNFLMCDFEGVKTPFDLTVSVQGNQHTVERKVPVQAGIRTVTRKLGAHRQLQVLLCAELSDRITLRSSFADMKGGHVG